MLRIVFLCSNYDIYLDLVTGSAETISIGIKTADSQTKSEPIISSPPLGIPALNKSHADSTGKNVKDKNAINNAMRQLTGEL